MNIVRNVPFQSSWRQGFIDIAYAEIVARLGEPVSYVDGKVDTEWSLELDGVYCTIYNYKDGVNYLGDEGIPTTDIRDWHIGGTGPEAVNKVRELFGHHHE